MVVWLHHRTEWADPHGVVIGVQPVDQRKGYWSARLSSEIPPGSSLSQVQVFFDESGLEYGYDERNRTVNAVERDISKSSLVSWSVAIECKIDSSDKLESCKAEAVGTGP
jgi:hypothetical protein